MRKPTGPSIRALLAGFVFVVVTSLGTDAALHAAGVFPPWEQTMSDPQFLWALIYRTVYGIAGAYIAAILAPDRKMDHALVSGAVGFVLSLIGLVGTWNMGPQFGPKWYPIGLVLTTLPGAWLGAKLYLIRNKS